MRLQQCWQHQDRFHPRWEKVLWGQMRLQRESRDFPRVQPQGAHAVLGGMGWGWGEWGEQGFPTPQIHPELWQQLSQAMLLQELCPKLGSSSLFKATRQHTLKSLVRAGPPWALARCAPACCICNGLEAALCCDRLWFQLLLGW